MKYKDRIKGGVGDEKTPSDFPKKYIEQGMKVEMEHTNDPILAKEIAIDHLTEFPKYYTELAKMEEKLKKDMKKKHGKKNNPFLKDQLLDDLKNIGKDIIESSEYSNTVKKNARWILKNDKDLILDLISDIEDIKNEYPDVNEVIDRLLEGEEEKQDSYEQDESRRMRSIEERRMDAKLQEYLTKSQVNFLETLEYLNKDNVFDIINLSSDAEDFLEPDDFKTFKKLQHGKKNNPVGFKDEQESQSRPHGLKYTLDEAKSFNKEFQKIGFISSEPIKNAIQYTFKITKEEFNKREYKFNFFPTTYYNLNLKLENNLRYALDQYDEALVTIPKLKGRSQGYIIAVKIGGKLYDFDSEGVINYKHRIIINFFIEQMGLGRMAWSGREKGTDRARYKYPIEHFKNNPTKKQNPTNKTALIPPESVAHEAEKGLKLRKKFGRGGTEVGVHRAVQLKNRQNLSPKTIMRMVSFFARHGVHEGMNFRENGEPTNHYIAWLLWGGDAGRDWANRMNKRVVKKNNPTENEDETTYAINNVDELIDACESIVFTYKSFDLDEIEERNISFGLRDDYPYEVSVFLDDERDTVYHEFSINPKLKEQLNLEKITDEVFSKAVEWAKEQEKSIQDSFEEFKNLYDEFREEVKDLVEQYFSNSKEKWNDYYTDSSYLELPDYKGIGWFTIRVSDHDLGSQTLKYMGRSGRGTGKTFNIQFNKERKISSPYKSIKDKSDIERYFSTDSLEDLEAWLGDHPYNDENFGKSFFEWIEND